MPKSQNAKKLISTYDTALQLAKLMRENSAGIDRNLVREGGEIIGFFMDSNYGKHTKDYESLKDQTLRFVIDDVGLGGYSISINKVGLLFKNGQVKTFITPLGQTPDGNVIMSFSLKNRVAFQKYRKEANEGMDQETIDKALYFLAHLLAEQME